MACACALYCVYQLVFIAWIGQSFFILGYPYSLSFIIERKSMRMARNRSRQKTSLLLMKLRELVLVSVVRSLSSLCSLLVVVVCEVACSSSSITTMCILGYELSFAEMALLFIIWLVAASFCRGGIVGQAADESPSMGHLCKSARASEFRCVVYVRIVVRFFLISTHKESVPRAA